MKPSVLAFPAPQGPALTADLIRFGFSEVGHKVGGNLAAPRRLFWHPQGVLVEAEDGERPAGRLYASLAVCGSSSEHCSAFLASLTPDEPFFICPRADGTLRVAARLAFSGDGPWALLDRLQELGRLTTPEDDGPAGWRHTAEMGGFCFERSSGTRTTWLPAAPYFLHGAPREQGPVHALSLTARDRMWSNQVENHCGFHTYTADRLHGEPEHGAWRQRVSRWGKAMVPDDAAWRLVRAEAFRHPVGPGGLCLPACLIRAGRFHQGKRELLERAVALLEEAPDHVFRAWSMTVDNQGMILGLHLLAAALEDASVALLRRALRVMAERSQGTAPLYTSNHHVLGLLLSAHLARPQDVVRWRMEPPGYVRLTRLLEDAESQGLDWGRDQPVSWQERRGENPEAMVHRVARMTGTTWAQVYGPEKLAKSPAIQRLWARLTAADLGRDLPPDERTCAPLRRL